MTYFNECEWCHTIYPNEDKTVVYYSIFVFGKKHKICNECKNRLEIVK